MVAPGRRDPLFVHVHQLTKQFDIAATSEHKVE